MTTTISEALSSSGLAKLLEAERKAYIKQQVNKTLGMIKVKTPEGFNLFEFDVADHITLFDED